ncbi:MAG: arylsulfatase [Rikenellaceae bacterium]
MIENNNATRLLFTLTCGLLSYTMAHAQERANVIIILCDDMGYSDLGCYGSPDIETPNIDRMAAEGMMMTQFYNTPRSCPSRAALLTGVYPHEAGMGHMVYTNAGPGYEGNLSVNSVTMGEVLSDAGYNTMFVGKWHVGHSSLDARPEVRGYDKFTGIYTHMDAYWSILEGCEIYKDRELFIPAGQNPVNPFNPDKEFYTTDFFTDAAINYLQEYQSEGSEDPFYMHICYNAPHFPLEAPDDLIEKYEQRYKKGWEALRDEKFAKMKELGLLKSEQKIPQQRVVHENKTLGRNYAINEIGEPIPLWRDISEEDREDLVFRRAIYAAQIDNLDQNVGRLITYLEEQGLKDNTLIMFMSDNGCSAEIGVFGCNWGLNTKANYDEWRSVGGWSASQGDCWSGYSNFPHRLHKQFAFEGGIASPFIALWPKGMVESGRVEMEQVGHLVDVMATVVDISDSRYPKEYQGRDIHKARGISLLPHITGETKKSEERELFWHHQNSAAIRSGDWKLVTNDDQNDAAWELYDLTNDRSETNNVIHSYPKLAKKLKKRWFDWAREVNAYPFIEDRTIENNAWPAIDWE